MSPNPPIGSLQVPDYAAGGFEPSVAQPPLPLQEFLPLQPLSPALQPPLPLQEFWPLQACLSFALAWSLVWSCDWRDALAPERRLDAWIVAPLPASNPASAAPAIRAFFDFVISSKLLLIEWIWAQLPRGRGTHPRSIWIYPTCFVRSGRFASWAPDTPHQAGMRVIVFLLPGNSLMSARLAPLGPGPKAPGEQARRAQIASRTEQSLVA